MYSQIDISLSQKCNLNCPWCYAHNDSTTYNQEMVDDTMKWIIGQFVPQNPNHKLSCTIYGGEPLCEWNNLKILVKKYPNIWWGLVTNCTLLDNDKLQWLIANRVSIHPSIDGCPGAIDRNRFWMSGDERVGASEKVVENCKRLLFYQPNRSARMTLGPDTVDYFYYSVLFLAKTVGFRTINHILAGGIEWPDSALDEYINQLKKVTDWWASEYKKGYNFDLYYIRNMALGFKNGRRMRRLCGAGWSRCAITTDGLITPCHRFGNLTPKEWVLGDIHDGITNESLVNQLKNYDLVNENKDRCQGCNAEVSCHAWCAHEMMIQGGLGVLPSHYCRVWKVYMEEYKRAQELIK